MDPPETETTVFDAPETETSVFDAPPTTDDDDALDLEEVKRLATEENYELVHFSKETRLISFEPMGGGEDDDDENYSNDVKINVYWTTGTVGTCLDHPKRGKTQRFRRHVELRDLVKIFRNPCVRTGAGYYETQDASPVDFPPDDDSNHVALLQETNQMLREQIMDSQQIEITGPRGNPVYATGSFRDGRWKLKRGGLWGVDLAMMVASTDDDDDDGEASSASGSAIIKVPISALEDIEIRLGGVLYASACSHDVYAQMEEQDWDGDTMKEVLCHFGGPVTGVWLPLRIDGWPRSHWSGVQSKYLSRQRNDYRENLDVYGVLLEEVNDLYPQATLSFHRLSFFGECVEQMVDNLGLAPKAEGKKQEKEELWNIANLIVIALRSSGNEDIGEAFMKRVNDLQIAAYMMLTINNESNEAVEAEVPALVQLQLDSQSTAAFFV
eukprot:CAMPEP_0202020868 /NCGR_PEP_ID=MMETSP0905-20130828/45506_1 /ASSEMBLY_ACC=CAM_ASM_000554 /TAXON_ID=420261 /ORGANISM="Thalassiosira antarctica, Strain CCMP982" /LENGTH=439 /DNA_ID=CAMNT_0048582575 /DNA_START=40 /DNA_END=1359 /DNA_ORIENTATION=+